MMLLALAVAGPVIAAGPFDDGMEAYQRQDYVTALRLWRPLAAELGYAHGLAAAQYNLGLMYQDGQGVQQNYSLAVNWYWLAAAQGHGRAQNDIGYMYLNGLGVPQDYVLAHMWFNLAAAGSPSEFSDAKTRAQAAENRDLAARKMTPAQIAEAQRRAREWTPK